ncbi:MAG: hypothetical protein J5710_01220 [Treponema sp.]|nr:hypothetical protein [Treponema sp.]
MKIFIHKLNLFSKDGISFLGKMKVFFLSMIALYSIQPYFFWDKNIVLAGFSILSFFFTFLEVFQKKKYLKLLINKEAIATFSVFLLFFTWWHIVFFWSTKLNVFGFVSSFIVFFLPVSIFIFSSDLEKRYFLSLFTFIFSIICFVSFSFFVLHLLGFSLPYTELYHPKNTFYDHFENYRFFIIVRSGNIIPVFFRFQSIFTEPGHLGMICALLLYANEYNFKKIHNIILLLCLLFSLSLAAYILFISGLFIYKYFSSKRKLPMILFLSCLIILLTLLGMMYYKSNPDSVLSQRILSRLILDKDKGIVGNNRNTEQFTKIFSEFTSEPTKFFFGSGTTVNALFPKGGESSYKNFVFEHGLLGLIFLGLFYLSSVINRKKPVLYGMFILWALSFIQRPYAVWTSQIFIFMSYCVYASNDKKKINMN